jgi:two-component system CheB/CheR fusion protein
MALLDSQINVGELIANLRIRFGKDFTSFRSSCLKRRLALRMSSLGLSTLDGYLDYLSTHPAEIEQLLDTVTIHVTEFFRDHEVYDAIAKKILPEMADRKIHSPSRTIRVWSAGCSTGEETYSIAILMLHYLRSNDIGLDLEVFGTDISKESCRISRRGIYAERKVARVPATLRQKYFEPEETGLKIAGDVRRFVKFQVHDLFSAPPFSRLDMLVCRNVLIHFDGAVRNDVLTRFHAALDDGGVLVLGKSEAVTGTALNLFELIDPRNKMYRKNILHDSEGERQ